MTVVRQRIDVPVPRKRKGQSGVHEKVRPQRFARAPAVIRSLTASGRPLFSLPAGDGALLPNLLPGRPSPSAVRHAQGHRRRLAWLHARRRASPPPFAPARRPCLLTRTSLPQVYDYIFAEAVRTTNKPLLQARSKFLRVHTTSSHVHSLVEALRSAEVSALLAGTKYAREGLALDKCVPTSLLLPLLGASGLTLGSRSLTGSIRCSVRTSCAHGTGRITSRWPSSEARSGRCSSRTSSSGASSSLCDQRVRPH